MNYRRDVQMLRGVAVLFVVLFHLGLGAFRSGFLGVDIFFVISGYLMAAMYTPEDKFSFFEKRARRLLPAYFATIAATLVAGAVITTPSDFSQIVSQSWFAVFLASNVGYWVENSYFDKAAFKPLLHLWSLGVEIQFYICVPVISWLIARTRAIGYWVLTLGSLATCLFVVGISPKTSFFWMPLRLWEFLLGFGTAYYFRTSGAVSPRLQPVGMAAALGLLLIPFVPVQGDSLSALHGHPGLAAVTITFATAIVLRCGLPLWLQNNPVSKGLERIGDWSYSIYLAHFPVIVLALYQPFSGTLLNAPTITDLVLVIILLLAASVALYFFIEKPLRQKPLRLQVVAPVVAGLAAFAFWAPIVQSSWFPASERLLFSAWEDRSQYRCGKLSRVLHPASLTCEITPPTTSPTARILLVGNSHADSIKTTFAEAATARGAAVHFVVTNTPLIGGMPPAVLVNEALKIRSDAIVLHYSPNSVSTDTVRELALLAWSHGLRVALILPVPTWKQHVPKMLWASVKQGAVVDSQTIEDYRLANRSFVEGVGIIPRLKTYDVADYFCAPHCRVLDELGRPIYFDSSHLTLSGSALLRPVFDQVVADVSSASQSIPQ